ncbi:hypothetical protein BLNAU_3554 [Blattamonas nauphoetae]|uniref:Uncharacterized protein n=1 Tax=Blattamonas nauphoetae TaxID=2049346 RepID=A0ABQ9YCM0_9EUKA|nr:hypothetical protein BLNAU_3554 [Blattamonas nauphoetae]
MQRVRRFCLPTSLEVGKERLFSSSSKRFQRYISAFRIVACLSLAILIYLCISSENFELVYHGSISNLLIFFYFLLTCLYPYNSSTVFSHPKYAILQTAKLIRSDVVLYYISLIALSFSFQSLVLFWSQFDFTTHIGEMSIEDKDILKKGTFS